LGKFWRVLQWKMMVYFMDSWSILRSFVIFYRHLVYVVRGNLVYFSPVLVFCTKKNLATLLAISRLKSNAFLGRRTKQSLHCCVQ
jgi:hypothetical protein